MIFKSSLDTSLILNRKYHKETTKKKRQKNQKETKKGKGKEKNGGIFINR